MIKAIYYVIEPHYMEGTTPDGPVANMPLFISL